MSIRRRTETWQRSSGRRACGASRPDHTLVLVNGKRRHRGAVIAWQGSGVADGAQGSDISTIPAIALRGIEVLRDGAAAQYGSDAIGGVLNLLLKDDRSGGRVELRSGTHAAGDGREYGVAANAGLPLGRAGFANLSLEYGETGSTDRSVQRADAAGLIAAGNGHVRDPAQRWGAPDVGDDLKLFANLGHVFTNGVQAYGHANYARRDVLTFFYYRNPNTRGGVFSNDGGRTLLVGDVLAARGEGSANCPTVVIEDDVPDPAALEEVFADPDCFSFQELFPGGFAPRFGGVERDVSVVPAAYVGSVRRRRPLGRERHRPGRTRRTSPCATRSTPRSAPRRRRRSTSASTGNGRSASTWTSAIR